MIPPVLVKWVTTPGPVKGFCRMLPCAVFTVGLAVAELKHVAGGAPYVVTTWVAGGVACLNDTWYPTAGAPSLCDCSPQSVANMDEVR